MTGRVQQRRSITASTVPTAGQMLQGEILLNINALDKKAYVKLSDDSIFEFAGSSYALLASPTFTGTPTVPTATGGDNSTTAASTAFVQGELSGISSSTVTHDISQSSHGFAVGEVVRYNGTIYVTAQADSAENAETLGMVSAVADANAFTLQTDGRVTDLSGLTAGSLYFLSESSAGAITATEPSADGEISKPMLIADSTTTGYLLQYRGKIIGGDPSGGGSASTVVYEVAQTGHGLTVGQAVRFNGTLYVTAQADSAENAETLGMVSAVADANAFTLQLHGRIEGLSGLTAGDVYFLSEATAGAITATEPSAVGEIAKPMLIADSATTGFVLQYRGNIVSESIANATAKAWVAFNGGGTVAIKDSLNVTSVTDNGTGNYAVNFIVNFASSNYAPVISSGDTAVIGGGTSAIVMEHRNASVSSCDVRGYVYTGTSNSTIAFDLTNLSAVFFGD